MEYCEQCNEKYDADTEGITTKDRYTGQEHEFCSGECLKTFIDEGNTIS